MRTQSYSERGNIPLRNACPRVPSKMRMAWSLQLQGCVGSLPTPSWEGGASANGRRPLLYVPMRNAECGMRNNRLRINHPVENRAVGGIHGHDNLIGRG